ncbi:MAG: hypothetical protein ACUVR0_11945 [Candidatus Aminicenantales bacterium]
MQCPDVDVRVKLSHERVLLANLLGLSFAEILEIGINLGWR